MLSIEWVRYLGRAGVDKSVGLRCIEKVWSEAFSRDRAPLFKKFPEVEVRKAKEQTRTPVQHMVARPPLDASGTLCSLACLACHPVSGKSASTYSVARGLFQVYSKLNHTTLISYFALRLTPPYLT